MAFILLNSVGIAFLFLKRLFFPVLQILVNGLIAGSIYALVAVGFSLIYSTNRFMHFAHGSTVAVGAYLLFTLFSLFKFDFWISMVLTVIGAGLFGVLLNRLVYKPLRQKKASSVILLVASFGLLVLIESLILMIFGADIKTIGFIKIAKGIELFGAIITPLQIVIIGTALSLLVILFLFMKYHRLGKALRAVASNPQKSEIVGISSEKIFELSMMLGSALAGIAGILVGLEQNLDPSMGTSLIIKGFTGAIIGGVTSVPGAVLGSYVLGIVENVGIWFLPSGYKDAIAFTILFLFLLFRPNGILGISRGVNKGD